MACILIAILLSPVLAVLLLAGFAWRAAVRVSRMGSAARGSWWDR